MVTKGDLWYALDLLVKANRSENRVHPFSLNMQEALANADTMLKQKPKS